MADEHITCGDCGQDFIFSDTERAFYEQRNLAVPPKRCKPCRDARKQSRGPAPSEAGRQGRGGAYGGQARGGPPGAPRGDRGGDRGPDRGMAPSRRYSGDVNEYRSPMAGPDPWGAPASNSRSRFGGGESPGRGYGDQQGGQPAPRGRYGSEGHGGGAERGAPRGDFRGGGGAVRGGGNGPGGGRNEYRSPAFPDERARPAWGDPRPARRGPSADGRAQAPRKAPADAERQAPKPKKARPTFEIVCDKCGEKSQVPFEPEEGRDIFCQPCYQARREELPEQRQPGRSRQQAAPAPQEDVAEPAAEDVEGVVEE